MLMKISLGSKEHHLSVQRVLIPSDQRFVFATFLENLNENDVISSVNTGAGASC